MSKYRHEYKYFLDARKQRILLVKAEGLLERDQHTDNSGAYWIRSLYFDDFDNTCFYENRNGTDRRSKFRIRYYNDDISYIVLEKKSKVRGMTRKDSCRISAEESLQFLNGRIPAYINEPNELKKKLLLEMQLRTLRPKIIVTYKRNPFIYSAGNVRITFDQNITSSIEITRFLSGDYQERPVLMCGSSILEVKWDDILPLHIREHMKMDTLQWTSFSKYYMCRMYHL